MRGLMVGLVALIAFGLCGGYVAGAVTRPSTPANEALTGSLAEIAVVRSEAQSPVEVSTPTGVASAVLVVTVPEGKQDLFAVRFSGVVSYPDGPSFPVAVDVTVNGIAMPPSELQAWPSGAASPIPFQLERAIGPLISGTYRIGIVLTGSDATDHRTLQLLGWTLVSQRTSETARSGSAAV
jgi:hypothetical protein